MSKWGIGAAILAALVGVYVYEKSTEKKPAPTKPKAEHSPKGRFEEGKTAGYAAGLADAKAKHTPRVVIDAAKVDSLLKSPSDWMYDPDKAYTTGYNIGYFNGYQAGLGLAGVSDVKEFKKADYCPTAADIDGITARIMLGTMSVEEAVAMDADLSSRTLGDPRGYCALPFAWAKVRMAIAEKSAPAPEKYTATLMPAGSPTFAPPISAKPAPDSDPFAGLPDDIMSHVRSAYDSGDAQQLDDVASDYLVPYPTAQKKVKADAVVLRVHWFKPLTDFDFSRISDEDYGTLKEMSKAIDAPWLLDDMFLWKGDVLRLHFPPGKVADEFWRRGFKTVANQFIHLFDGATEYPMSPDTWYPLPSVSGVHGGYGMATGQMEIGPRISPEWRKQIPAWYLHPSFKTMRGR